MSDLRYYLCYAVDCSLSLLMPPLLTREPYWAPSYLLHLPEQFHLANWNSVVKECSINALHFLLLWSGLPFLNLFSFSLDEFMCFSWDMFHSCHVSISGVSTPVCICPSCLCDYPIIPNVPTPASNCLHFLLYSLPISSCLLPDCRVPLSPISLSVLHLQFSILCLSLRYQFPF